MARAVFRCLLVRHELREIALITDHSGGAHRVPAGSFHDAVVVDRVESEAGVGEQSLEAAIAAVITYASEFNDLVHGIGRFRPFGGLRGFKGSGRSLDPKTTRWILKGMGFSLQ